MIFKSHVRARVEVVEIQPGDVIIIESDDDLSSEQAAGLQKAWHRSASLDIPMVLSRGMRINVIRDKTKEHMR